MQIRTILAAGSFLYGTAILAAAGGPAPVRMPFVIVENRGQDPESVRYTGTGADFKAWFEDRGIVLQQGDTAVRISFEGSAMPAISPEAATGATASYLRGNDRSQWRSGLPLFAALRYRGLWTGIDVAYKAEQGRVKAEYIVAPGGDPNDIRLRFDGEVAIQSDGSLRAETSSTADGHRGYFFEEKPFIYQVSAHGRREVAGAYEKRVDGTIGFGVEAYDRTLPLVIDPSILFSGYFGGSSEEAITGVAIDSLNNVVVAGWTSSTNLPASSGVRTASGGGVDAFVAAFLPNGGGLIYCTYLGGSGDDRAFGVAVDSTRAVYVTGWTSSSNFPVSGGVQHHLSGTRDAFIAKLSPGGNSFDYSTYLGGSGVDTGNAIAIDTTTNSAVVVGDSTSTNLPTTTSAYQKTLAGGQDTFIAELSPQGNSLTFLTYFGGTGQDHASCLYVGLGTIFVGGYTWSTNLPTVHAFQPGSGGGQDGFVAKFSATASALLFSSYIGGSGGSSGAPEEVNAIYRTPQGPIFVAGTTSSSNFPVTSGAFQTSLNGSTNGFISMIAGTYNLTESTYFGGSSTDGINAITVDFNGQPYVTGYTTSQDFPVQRPVQSANQGGMDAFVAKLNRQLTGLVFGTYLGGSGSEQGNAIAVDGETSIVVAGQTSSWNLPVAGSLAASPPGSLSTFITTLAPNFMLGVAYPFSSQMAFTADPWRVASYVSSALYGNSTDLPIAGDWNGTGIKNIGVFRNGTWYLDTNGNGVLDAGDKVVSFGQAGDIPVVGDWRGTGHIALGLFRQGTFILDLSGHLSGVATGLNDVSFSFGQNGDLPIAADWNGSGTTKVGIFRNGLWIVDFTGSHVFNSVTYTYGQAGDIPVVGDWDSSGNPPKIGIYRNGLWVLDYDGDHVWTTPGLTEMAVGFGFAGYKPLVF